MPTDNGNLIDIVLPCRMSEHVAKLLKEAEKLSAEERLELIEWLEASLSPPDPAVEQAWIEECDRRLDEHRRDPSKARDAVDVFAKHLKP